MVPMALGLGEGGGQSAPLGRAVIGGLIGATCATLVILPAISATLQSRRAQISASLDPTTRAAAISSRNRGSRRCRIVATDAPDTGIGH